MNDATAAVLLDLNQKFYNQFSSSFDTSRYLALPGMYRAVQFLPAKRVNMLDVGCGNGIFSRFMLKNNYLERYLGVDFSAGLLNAATQYEQSEGETVSFVTRDISQPGFLDGLGQFDLITCFAAMHHIPQHRRRAAMLTEMGKHLLPGGLLFMSNWQFLTSERQRRKVLPWSDIGLEPDDVESHDYLLSWQRGGFGRRYVCQIEVEETQLLVEKSGLIQFDQYRADGKEGDLSLYTILKRAESHLHDQIDSVETGSPLVE